MKNKFFNQNTKQNFKQNMKQQTLQEPTGKGVIFIKSRKSDNKIHNMVSNICVHAKERDVEIVDIIVDESSGVDVDRSEVDRLWDWVENSPVGIIYLKSIFDITSNEDDLEKFFARAEYYGMILVDMEAHVAFVPDMVEENAE
ncbi:hypothetical protein DFR55_12912 [Herbinix hemicellulosilytica]|uniref:Resolvase/invertase-type recombinase catalytic domain-containing protein n=1 Tax=Herbinix hemicellulosilytica TaxID=1564487 RepID=A0A0H5SHW3_HERHM|nr:recombinase family protein [Herbinix hemicellulosilytica]RBP57073.1 hypothetical protein DFR55_12912 [Herbinix hemicellulosilytica]CRZ35082.1 hypothetical protein HHT355_1883 [Herbinix hemicellulosilytica]